MTTPGNLRVGDAERTAVTEALHDHFAAGRLTREELDERLDTTLAAKTGADLREVVKDLPGPNGLAAPEPYKQHPYAHRRRHRHGPPPFVPFLFVFLIIAVVAGGPGGAFVFALKVLFVLWLASAVFGLMRLRRWRRQR